MQPRPRTQRPRRHAPVTRRDARVAAETTTLRASWLLAFIAFATACVWTIAVARAEPVESSREHVGFVVDAPGVLDGSLALPSPQLTLARDAMMRDSLRLEPATGPSLARRGIEPLRLAIGPRHDPDRVGIGRTIHLGGHRELVLDLTPSPRHCAPLVAVSF